MNRLLILLFTLIFFSCKQSNKPVELKPLMHTEFNGASLEVNIGLVLFDSIKAKYDSCKSFTFPANAILINKKDSLFIGNIVNRQTLKIVNTLKDAGFTEDELLPQTHILSTPCYEKNNLHISVKALFGENFSLHIPNAGTAVNNELNDDITNAENNELKTGSWIYLDLSHSLLNILDSEKSTAAIAYKKDLANADNMVLATVESVSDISFIIKTTKAMSGSLQSLLQSKPNANIANPKFKAQLFFIADNKFQISFTGLFPVAGRFMKAE